MSDELSRKPSRGSPDQSRNADARGIAECGETASLGADDATLDLDVRCPQCRQVVQLESNSDLSNVQCSCCGVHFNLLRDEQLSVESAPSSVGHFQLLEQIGRGAFGAVWRARDTQLDRIVALKLPRKGQLGEDEAEQFFREARAAAQLEHPHIVSVHEVGRQANQLYIVSDFVEGTTLQQWAATQQPTFRQTAAVCAQLAEALQHAHSRGVIHRDLKPTNVMLTPDGQPKVMDFGLARREAGELTMTWDGQILGTPAYMSPEQARGESHQADRRSDIYSLGVILFELLTNERPFRGSLRMVLEQVLHDDPPSPRKLDSAIPRDLETICLKCLEREPGRRYPSAGDVVAELRRYLSGEPITARRISTAERTWRWCRRRPAVAGLLAALAVALIAGFVGITSQLLRAEAARRQAEVEGHNTQIALDQVRDQSLQTRQFLYVADMRSMQQEWNEGNLSRMHQLLQRHRPPEGQPDVRTWAWYYWWRHSHAYAAVLRDPGRVSKLAFSPDGLWLASLRDGEVRPTRPAGVRIWNRQTGELYREIDLAGSYPSLLVWSPDSRHILASQHGVPAGWDIHTGSRSVHLVGSPDRPDSHADGPSAAAFSPDGQELIISCIQGISRWHWPSQRFLELLPFQQQRRHFQPVFYPLALSQDGQFLAAADPELGAVLLWTNPGSSSKRKQLVLEMPAGYHLNRLVFAPDSQQLWGCDFNGLFYLWTRTAEDNWQQEPVDAQWRVKAGGFPALACTVDGAQVLIGGRRRVIWQWDRSKRELTQLGLFHGEPVLDIAVAPDGRLGASSDSQGTITLWPITGEDSSLRGTFSDVALSPDGRLLATLRRHGDQDTMGIWDVAHRRLLHEFLAHHQQPQALVFAADNRRLASAARDGYVKLWDTQTATLLQSWKGIIARRGQTLTISPDGKTVAVYDQTNTLLLLDVETGTSQPAPQFLADCAWPIQFHPSGQLLVGRPGRVLELWDLQRQDRKAVFQGGDASALRVVFSHDGQLLAAGHLDRRVILWNATDGRLITTLVGNSDGVWSLAFSRDDRTLASAGGDLRLWNLTTNESIGSFDFTAVMGFSADQTDLVVSGERRLELLTAATRPQVLRFDQQRDAGTSSVLRPQQLRVRAASAPRPDR